MQEAGFFKSASPPAYEPLPLLFYIVCFMLFCSPPCTEDPAAIIRTVILKDLPSCPPSRKE
jgi:hypothetical protein